MEKISTFIVDSIPEDATPGIIILFLLITSFIYALSKANIIYDFVDKFSKRELINFRQLLADENVSEQAKIGLKGKISLIAYQKATGLKINNVCMQEQIVEYYRLAKGRLRYSDFRRAFALLKIDENDILVIRNPNTSEKIAHIWWIVSSTFFLVVIILLLAALIYSSISIQKQIYLFLLVVFFGFIFFAFAYLASLIPTAKKIKNELRKNKFIIQRNIKKIELRHIKLTKEKFTLPLDFEGDVIKEVSSLPFHPLAHLTIEERQNRIKQVLGVWQNDTEIDTIFAEIDLERHSYRGRQIDSLDD